MNVLVSACLIGVNCKYNGYSNQLPNLVAELMSAGLGVVVICPEVAGGLSIPRSPAERKGDRVVNMNGEDVTEQYEAGALAALKLAKKNGCEAAILKKYSPSCGTGKIYDGTFSGAIVDRDGVTAELLRANGIAVYDEDNYHELLKDFEPDFW